MPSKPISRRTFLSNCAATAGVSLLPVDFALGAVKTSRKNVLFIAVDDLSTRLSAYGHPLVKTPHIDRLASEGALFTRAFCQFPGCGGSRGSLLTGARPTLSRFDHWDSRISKEMPQAITLPAWFRSQGYYTVGYGKIEHGFYDIRKDWNYNFRSQAKTTDKSKPAKPYTALSKQQLLQTDPLRDTALADAGVLQLEHIEKEQTPFFLGIGFYKPHLPYEAPEEFWSWYSDEDIGKEDQRVRDTTRLTHFITKANEIRAYGGVPKTGAFPERLTRKLLHGYFACTSYIDSQIGRVLQALDSSKHRDNTIVVLWSDHSFSLGEHGLWAKGTLAYDQIHVPLIVRAPGFPANTRIDALTELVDIYPTLCELSGLAAPTEQLEGSSFAPLLANSQTPWKKAVFSQSSRGVAVLNKNYSYCELRRKGKKVEQILLETQKPKHKPANLAMLPEYQTTLTELSKALREGWRAALP